MRWGRRPGPRRLNPIHEGTHGIQAIDLLGRKTALRDGAGLRALESLLRRGVDTARRRGGEAATLARRLEEAVDRLVEVTTLVHAEPDPDVRLANASVHLEATGHVVVAWVWLEQFLAAGDADDDLRAGKRQAARYFFGYELPRVFPQLDLLARLDRTTLETDPAWF